MKLSKSKKKDSFALYSDLSRFANAVNYYLSYIDLVAVPDSDKKADSRPHFITESAVRFPLAEYLERRLYVSDLELEYNYPKMQSKRCDFKFTIKRANESNDCCLAELKYVKSRIDLQDYFNDLMRLHFARMFEPNTKTFFIVCGKLSDMTHFVKDRVVVQNVDKREDNTGDPFHTKQEKKGQAVHLQKGTIGTDWLLFSDDKHSMKIDSMYWNEFILSHFYKVDRSTKQSIAIIDPLPQMPEIIQTKRICMAGVEKDSEHTVGIWEVF